MTVHTLGYGESLSNLVRRATCNRPLKFTSGSDINVDDVYPNCSLPKKDISKLIVDERRLRDIAKATPAGIYKLSPDAKAVEQSLLIFLRTLREYELIYRQPGADRLTLHQTKVRVTRFNLTSPSKDIRVCLRGCNSFSLLESFVIFAVSISLFLLGILLFIRWSKGLKEES